MIVEYYGIPGSGKTYLANLYKEQLKQEGKKFIDISRHSGMPLWLKTFYKFADYIILILPKYRWQISAYIEVCKDSIKEPDFLPLSKQYCIRDIVIYSLVYDVFSHLNRITLNDEGQLHRVLFLSVQFRVPLEYLMPVYQTFRHEGSCRYVKTTSGKAIQNIKHRNRKVCEMDEMKEEVLRDYIKAFEGVCCKMESLNHEFVDIIMNNK